MIINSINDKGERVREREREGEREDTVEQYGQDLIS